MKVRLMYADRDFTPRATVPICEGAVVEDLALETLIAVMARGDAGIVEVVREALLQSLTDVRSILFRQAALQDCIERAAAVRELYALAVETLEAERRAFLLGMTGRTAGSVLFRAVELLEMLDERLQGLRRFADRNAFGFSSAAFATLFEMLRRELSDDYLDSIREHRRQLRFPNGVLLSAHLGAANKGAGYIVRKAADGEGWLRRTLRGNATASYSFKIHDQDEGGARALATLKDRGIALVADALAQSADHILAFFQMLRTELAFYVGCLNLHDVLSASGEPTCVPTPVNAAKQKRSAANLYDVSLALALGKGVVANDLNGDQKSLAIITGANRGGKSTFLRSVGLAQLMMQCGMFVAAERFEASLCQRIFSHFKRQEDPTMQSGKFEEELVRMSGIVDNLVPDSLVLLNESFAATDEREGAEIAYQVVTAVVERNVTVYFVTHQFEFAQRFLATEESSVLLLLAERRDDGTRTFKIEPGAPLETSYSKDLYDRIFGYDDTDVVET
jgi:DNA mismatch repair ATPase MutS